MPAAKARDVLHRRLEAVFASERFGELYGAAVPKVFLGFPKNEPPFYVAVDEICDTATTDGAASMGHAEVRFSLGVWVAASHRDLKTASDAVLSYADAIFASVLADPQLNMSVDNSYPRITSAGTAADDSKRYIAAMNIAIDCSVFSACPAEIKEAVDAANREDQL